MRLAKLLAAGALLALPGCAVYPADYGPGYPVSGPVVVGPAYAPAYVPPPVVVVPGPRYYRHDFGRRDWRGDHGRYDRHGHGRDHGRWR